MGAPITPIGTRFFAFAEEQLRISLTMHNYEVFCTVGMSLFLVALEVDAKPRFSCVVDMLMKL
jgi:hypothetical protein